MHFSLYREWVESREGKSGITGEHLVQEVAKNTFGDNVQVKGAVTATGEAVVCIITPL